jgi:hypothetical protein
VGRRGQGQWESHQGCSRECRIRMTSRVRTRHLEEKGGRASTTCTGQERSSLKMLSVLVTQQTMSAEGYPSSSSWPPVELDLGLFGCGDPKGNDLTAFPSHPGSSADSARNLIENRRGPLSSEDPLHSLRQLPRPCQFLSAVY